MSPFPIRHPNVLIIAFLFFIPVSAGCQRPFIDIEIPILEIVEPDLSRVVSEDEVTVRVRASSLRNVSRVDLGGVAMSKSQTRDVWEASVSLTEGINRLIVTAFDEDELPGVDTFLAFHMPFSASAAVSPLGRAIGAHAATLLTDGNVLISGGSETAGGPAVDEVRILAPLSSGSAPVIGRLSHARAGHTATRINNGRVLFLGGAVSPELKRLDDLVEAVELFDPLLREFHDIPVIGPPIRRIYHSASFRMAQDGPIVDLIGGEGDILYTPESVLGVRNDVRSFQLRNDTLYSLSPAPGPTIEQIAGHSQSRLVTQIAGEPGQFLVTGFRNGDPTQPLGFILDFTTRLGILIDPAPVPQIPRTLHASERLRDNIIGIFGGIPGTVGSVTNSSEIYVRETNRFYLIEDPGDQGFSRRYGHTATFVGADRILLIGGFDDGGNAFDRTAVFLYSL